MIEIIPAIDVIDGRCVRLTKGEYDTKKEYGDPVEMALWFESLGFRRLHLVDLDGARSKHVVNIDTLKAITRSVSLHVDFGGGVKSDDDLRKVFDAGAELVTAGSIAVSSPDTYFRWLETYGADHLILGADCRNGNISVNGWKDDGGVTLTGFLQRYMGCGTRNVLCTDISRDGMLQGPAIDLYKDIMAHYPHCHLIASGGVSCIEDLANLDEAGIPAVVMGKAIYEGKVDMKEVAKRFLAAERKGEAQC